jgi:hypothetical protein
MAGIKQTGGARIGQTYWKALRASWPFTSLQADEKEIVLSVLWTRHRFLRHDITRLSPYREPFGTSLRIEHSAASSPPFVLFRPPNFAALSAALQQLGYAIVEPE